VNAIKVENARQALEIENLKAQLVVGSRAMPHHVNDSRPVFVNRRSTGDPLPEPTEDDPASGP
jgi:hypothetical protein